MRAAYREERKRGPMRALKVATVVMGVLLVAGTAVLLAVIAHRVSGRSAVAPIPAHPIAATLDEPAGTRIAGIATVQDRLALQLQGGGPDRVVLVDPRTGDRLGTILLAR